jgi:peptidyl-prolyl cis-trans isomerase-like 4
VVLNDPFEDLKGMVIPEKSPEYKRDYSDTKHLDDDFDIDKFFKENDTEEKIKEKLRKQESKNKTVMLELLEDLPNSNVSPPKNVLFICRLNPITQAKDLENIFGKFGPIKDCKIVRDKKTKQSLKYGFIEFEKIEDCEKAYLKMDGALIDDFRIKVDFSQSVKNIENKKNNENDKNKKWNNDDYSNSDEEEDEKYYKKENRYNKYKDKELHIMNDEIRYKFEDNSKNYKYVFENKNETKNNLISKEEQNIKLKELKEISRRSSESKTISVRSRSRDKNYNNKNNNNSKYNNNRNNYYKHERNFNDKYYKYKNKDKYYH